MIRKREGFTLVELLVVIAIIIILAAILFPIFAKAREKAQQTRCLNNLKQMATACEMYEDDYEGGILPVSIGNGAIGQESSNIYWGYMWGDLMEPYMKANKKGTSFGKAGTSEVYRCPSFPEETQSEGASWFGDGGSKSYGYNPYLKKDVTTTLVKYPSLTLRITESANYIQDPHTVSSYDDAGFRGGSWYAPVPDIRPVGYQYKLYAPGYHAGHNDVLWFDGHVSSITWERVMYTDTYQGTTDRNVWCRLSPKDGYTAE